MVFSRHHLLTAIHPVEQHLQPIRMLGTHHQVEFGHPPQQGFALLLGHTSRHDDGEIRIQPFALGLSTEVAVNLLLGVVADRAGVVKDQIRLQFGVGCAIPHGFEDPGHPLGIRLVHLAAERGDPVAAAALRVCSWHKG